MSLEQLVSLEPSSFYVFIILLYFGFFCLFLRKKIIAKYFAIMGVSLLLTWILLFFLWIEQIPPENRTPLSFLDYLYFVSIAVPELLRDSGIADTDPLSFNFYDIFSISSIIGLIYLSFHIIKIKKINHEYISVSGRNKQVMLTVCLMVTSIIPVVYATDFKPVNDSVYESIRLILSALIIPLSVNFFYKQEKAVSTVIFYVLFACYAELLHILVLLFKGGINLKIAYLVPIILFHTLWYYFAYGKKMLVQFYYLIFFMVIRMVSYFVVSI